MKSRPTFVSLPVITREGEFVASYSATGLARLQFPSSVKRAKTGQARLQQIASRVRRWHAATTQALGAALAGRRPGKLPPLDFSAGTRFQQRVWRVLLKIAVGQTLSYQQVARAVGRAKAARAVGGACGANPIPVLVPCHRVLATGGGLGGFSAGLSWKKTLLAREGVVAG